MDYFISSWFVPGRCGVITVNAAETRSGTYPPPDDVVNESVDGYDIVYLTILVHQ